MPIDGNGMSATLSFTINFAAASMKSTPMVLEMNGNDRDARRLHSITITSLPLQMYCMLNGPVMCNSLTIFCVASSMRANVYSDTVCVGNINVASPECTPAFSTCSWIAQPTTLPSLAMPSISTSRPPWMNLEMTTGWSGDTPVASRRYSASFSAEYATFIAAPESTYDGRTRTG